MDVTDTLDGLVFGRMGSIEDLSKNNSKLLGWTGEQIQSKVRPTDEKLPSWDQNSKKSGTKNSETFQTSLSWCSLFLPGITEILRMFP